MKSIFKLHALNCKLLFTLLFIFSFNFMFAQDEKKPTENPYIGNRYYFDFGKPADENLYHIQQISKKKYLLNGYAKADRKRMNEILKHSENPLVVKQYKTANTLRNVTIVTQNSFIS